MTFILVLTVAVVTILIVLWRRTAETDEEFFCLDEDVQFSVYRPGTIVPDQWYPMLVFAHLSKPREGPNEPDPLEEVERQARHVLDKQFRDFQRLRQDSTAAVPHEGEITFVPSAQGIEFNPAHRTVRWLEDVHREEFRLRAPVSKDGQTLRGNIAVFLGAMLLADIALTIRVDSSFGTSVDTSLFDTAHARPYRRIFASYSHKDAEIVNQFEHYARAIGDRYLRDVANLRSGEVWNERLGQMIEHADVFQLFWSSNSMHSPFVKLEWQHALSLGKTGFVRPTYWEVPMPESLHEGLPPDELKQLHFQRIAVSRSPDNETEAVDPGARGRSMRDRVGLSAAVMTPFLVPIALFFSMGSSYRMSRMQTFLSPEFHGFGALLDFLWVLPAFASLFSLFIMSLMWFVRTISNRLWDALRRRGKGFWLLTTFAFSLLFGFPGLRIAFTMGISRRSALFLFPYLLTALSVWLSYAWVRWVFLPFFVKDRGGQSPSHYRMAGNP